MPILERHHDHQPSFWAWRIKQNKEVPTMEEYDLYIDPQKPTVGLYVRTGAGLPDLADPGQWVFDGTFAQCELPADLVQGIETNGHAFRGLG